MSLSSSTCAFSPIRRWKQADWAVDVLPANDPAIDPTIDPAIDPARGRNVDPCNDPGLPTTVFVNLAGGHFE